MELFCALHKREEKRKKWMGYLYLVLFALVIFRLFAYLSCFHMGPWTVYGFTIATAVLSLAVVVLSFPDMGRGAKILWIALEVSLFVSVMTHFSAIEYICNTAILFSALTTLPKVQWKGLYTEILFGVFSLYVLLVLIFVNRTLEDTNSFIYLNPNTVCFLIVVYQFILVAQARKQKNIVLKITFYLVTLATGFFQWQFGGRSSLIGKAVLVAYCVLQKFFDKFSRRKIKWLSVFLSLCSILFVVFYTFVLYPMLGDDTDLLGKDIFTNREVIWSDAFNALRGKWLFGIGQNLMSVSINGVDGPTNLHNVMMGYLTHFGVFSTLLYALLLGVLTAQVGKTKRKTTVAFLIAMTVMGYFDTVLFSTVNVIYLPIALTLIYNFDNQEERRKEMTIHYVWLGRGEKSEKIKYCIESWKQKCPDAKIVEWNEDNYDIRKNAYISEAYDNKKYAFVADYIRFDVLYKHGGVYMDTDVELLKDIAPLLDKPFMGLERAGDVNPGLIMNALGGEQALKEILDYYDSQRAFSMDKTVVDITSEILKKYGLTDKDEKQEVAEFIIYPTEYFNPKGGNYGKEKITENTYSIHHYEASWKSPLDQLIMSYKVKYGVKKGKLLFTLRHPIKAIQKWREK